MNYLKKTAAVLSVIALLLTFAGCHKKNEVAVKIGDVKFTSAYYMCAFIEADGEATTKVNEMAEKDDKIDTSKEGYQYSQKIDGKSYQEWTKDTAIASLKKIAAYKIKCNENKLKLEDADVSTAEQYADLYWSNGYKDFYEANGVSKETFKKYMTDSYYAEKYFEFLYGAEGEKAVSAEDVKNTLYENYMIVDELKVDLSSLETDDEKTAKTDALNSYVEQINSGKKTFEEIYHYENPDAAAHSDTTTDGTSAPKDSHAIVIGNDKASGSYQRDYYDTVKDLKVGEAVLYKSEDETTVAVLLKQDIAADEYYLESMDMTIRHDLKDDEYSKDIEKFIKTLDADISNYAVNRFKAKNIEYPTA